MHASVYRTDAAGGRHTLGKNFMEHRVKITRKDGGKV